MMDQNWENVFILMLSIEIRNCFMLVCSPVEPIHLLQTAIVQQPPFLLDNLEVPQ